MSSQGTFAILGPARYPGYFGAGCTGNSPEVSLTGEPLRLALLSQAAADFAGGLPDKAAGGTQFVRTDLDMFLQHPIGKAGRARSDTSSIQNIRSSTCSVGHAFLQRTRCAKLVIYASAALWQ